MVLSRSIAIIRPLDEKYGEGLLERSRLDVPKRRVA